MPYKRKFIQDPRDTINLIKHVIFGRDGYSPEMNDILKEMEKLPITNMTIIRTPLSLALNMVLNALTLGKIAKNSK